MPPVPSPIPASVAMTTYNGMRFLPAQLASVLAQLGPHDELVVCDDASSDGTWDHLRATAAGDARVRLLRHEVNRGLPATVQDALAAARGDVVFLADQDDVWLPGRRERVMATFGADPRVGVVVSEARVVDAYGAPLAESFMATRRGFRSSVLATLVRNRYLGCAMAVRRDVLRRALPIPARVPMHDMWLGVVGSLTSRVAYIPVPTVMYRRHGANLSPSRPAAIIKRLRWRVDLLFAVGGAVLQGRLR